ncbi:Helix-hairpin-helix domain-containing protein, partial [Candidatus Electrothrix marina]
CVGMKGARVQNVVQELQGERIDIVPWSPDPAKYVYNALAPAEVSMVIVDEEQHSLLVVVPDDQLSLAIGRQGQNVRLASRLLSWRIDVKSEQRYENLGNPGYKSLLAIDGVDEAKADKLVAAGIHSAGEFAEADIESIMRLVGVNEDQAAVLKLQAADIPVTQVASPLEEAERLFSAPVEQEEETSDDASDDELGNRIADDESVPRQAVSDEGNGEEAMPGNTVEPEDMSGNVPEQSGREQEMLSPLNSSPHDSSAQEPTSFDTVDGNRLS